MIRLAMFVVVVATSFRSLPAAEPGAWAKDHRDELVSFYEDLHRSPELSLHEEQTAAKIAAALKQAGLEVTTGVGGQGVVGVLANGQGPTLMIRCDLDALPVKEQTGLVYASTVVTKDDDGNDVGVMHACGHDIHMANLVGTARYLAENRDRWQGTVVFVAQPAEERGVGAKAMLADGLFERFPKPDLAIALHVDAQLAAGKVGYRAGYNLANVDSVDITMHGRGGHGAYPETTIDPIVQAAHLVLDLQTIISREIAPIDPAVITVGSIHGGTKHNIIGDECKLQLTVRSYSDAVRKHLLDGIRRKAKAVADSAGAPEPTVKVTEGISAMYNDEKLVERVVPVFDRVLGKENVVDAKPSMGGEDFAAYGRAGVPIFMFRLGSVDADRLAGYARVEQPPPSLHSPRYYPDPELTLETGIAVTSEVAIELLAKP